MKALGIHIDGEGLPSPARIEAAKLKLAALCREEGVDTYTTHVIRAWDPINSKFINRVDAHYEPNR